MDKPDKLVPFRKKEEPVSGVRRLANRPLVVAALSGLVTLAMLTPVLAPKIPVYEVGQIATADLIVPEDLTIQDTATTERRRAEALEQVPPVFDYDPADYGRALRALREGFQYARQAPADLSNDAVRLELSQRFQLTLSPDLVSALRAAGFSPKIEVVLTEILHEHYSQPVAAARVLAAYGRARDIVVRNIQTQEENRIQGKDVANDESLLRGVEKLILQSQALTPASLKRVCAALAGEMIHPNLHLNSYESEEREKMAVAQVNPVFYQLRRGRTILRKGDEITADKVNEITAVQQALAGRSRSAVALLALAVLIATIYFSLWYYLRSFYKGKKSPAECFVILSLIASVSALIYRFLQALAGLFAGTSTLAFLQDPGHYYYAIPFPLGALLLTILLDGHIAVIYALFNCLMVGLMFGGDFYVVLYSLLGSLAAIYGSTHYKERSAVYRTGLAVAIVSTFFALVLQLVTKPRPEPEPFLFVAAMAMLSGLLVAILDSFLLPMFETLFNFITDIKLLELANLNLPILRQLMLEAPGTYHHSILIGSLAEAGAESIGLNPLFLRTAALYHDMGKIKMAEYFIENQRGENPHDRLNPSMSALIIANHVKEGLEMAARIRLPKQITDCIPQHHGTRLMSYFYTKAKERQDPEMDPVKEEDYRHQGPKPQSKEAAIMMLADATEASARTLEDPSPGKLKNVIKKIFDTIIADGQLDECEINLKELDLIAKAFHRVLLGIYHRRIDYPGFQFEMRKSRNGKA